MSEQVDLPGAVDAYAAQGQNAEYASGSERRTSGIGAASSGASADSHENEIEG
jgi:hypothetical protein